MNQHLPKDSKRYQAKLKRALELYTANGWKKSHGWRTYPKENQLKERMSIRQIAKRLNLKRSNVSEYLRSQGIELQAGVGPNGRKAK